MNRIKRICVSKRKNSKRGITLLETVIALSLLAIISVVSISVSVSSIKSEERNIQSTEIALICENAVECFRFSKSSDKLKESFKESFEKTLKDGESLQEVENCYILQKTAYSVTFLIDGNKITVTAKDKNGKEIYSLEYVGAL